MEYLLKNGISSNIWKHWRLPPPSFLGIYNVHYLRTYLVVQWLRLHASIGIRIYVTSLLNPTPFLSPHSIPLGCRWALALGALLAIYFTYGNVCFNAILSNHPTLSFSHSVQKSVLYVCLLCCPACGLYLLILWLPSPLTGAISFSQRNKTVLKFLSLLLYLNVQKPLMPCEYKGI